MIRISPCWFCKHLHKTQDTCAAYPEGIPKRFLWGEKLHYKGARTSVRFEPEDGIDPFALEIAVAMGYPSPEEVPVGG